MSFEDWAEGIFKDVMENTWALDVEIENNDQEAMDLCLECLEPLLTEGIIQMEVQSEWHLQLTGTEEAINRAEEAIRLASVLHGRYPAGFGEDLLVGDWGEA